MYRYIPIKYSVFFENKSNGKAENPLSGNEITHISLEDEGGGAFVVLEQPTNEDSSGKIRLEVEELEHLAVIAREIVIEYERVNGDVDDEPTKEMPY